MGQQLERYLAFSYACQFRAKLEFFPPWRKKLLCLAQLTGREATLMERSQECIDESKELIARAEILLHRGR
jgi:hypothetical protein